MKNKLILFLLAGIILLPQISFAETFYFWRMRTHPTSCPSLTDGKISDLCYEEDQQVLYKCGATDGTCNTPAEWKLASSSSSGATAGGSNTAVQFNDNGVFLGESGLSFEKVSDLLTIGESGTDGILKLYADGVTDYSTIIQPGAQTQDVVLTLPVDDGASNQFLQTNGSGVLGWATPTGSGNVAGPGSATDTAIVRFDGTSGTLLKNSTVLIDGAGALTGVSSIVQTASADPGLVLNTVTSGDTDFWAAVTEDAGGDDDDSFEIGTGTTKGTAPKLSLNSGNLTIKAGGDLRLEEGAGTDYVGFQAPSSITTSTLFTLPDGPGTNGQTMITDGSGTLSWSNAGSASVAGSDGQIQYNNGGVLGATSTFLYDDTTDSLSVGDLSVDSGDPSVTFNVPTSGDTDYSIGANDDAGGDDDDPFEIRKGTIPGTGVILKYDKVGKWTIGGTGNTFNEQLIFDFEAANNTVQITSPTTVTGIWIGSDSGGPDLMLGNDRRLIFGQSGQNAIMKWTTVGGDNVQIGTRVGNASTTGYISIMEKADIDQPNRSPAASSIISGTTSSPDPVLRIYSSDQTNEDDYIEFSHNQTNAQIGVGTGNIAIKGLEVPDLSSCGSSPTIVGTGNSGKITIGTGTTTSCTMTFDVAYANAPACVVSGDNTAVNYKATTTTGVMTLTSSADMDSDVVSYICFGY